LEASNQLVLMAELGIGYAGFLAIFLAFTRQQEAFSPADSLRVRGMLLASFLAILGAIAPLTLVLFPMSEPLVWRLAGLGLLAGQLLVYWNVAANQLSIEPEGRLEGFDGTIAWCLGALGSLLLVLNATGLLSEPSAHLHVLSIVCMLGICTTAFVTIAFHRLL
jgi:hypothetical protein